MNLRKESVVIERIRMLVLPVRLLKEPILNNVEVTTYKKGSCYQPNDLETEMDGMDTNENSVDQNISNQHVIMLSS